MKVLIVDDNAGTREMIKVILRKTGHTTAGEAADGAEALKLYTELRPDVVLLDVIMPGKSGLETLAELRRLDPAAKVVMVTAVDQDSVNEELRRLGVTAVIYKPFSYDDFEKAFKKLG